jgi:hypothetical protein
VYFKEGRSCTGMQKMSLEGMNLWCDLTQMLLNMKFNNLPVKGVEILVGDTEVKLNGRVSDTDLSLVYVECRLDEPGVILYFYMHILKLNLSYYLLC